MRFRLLAALAILDRLRRPHRGRGRFLVPRRWRRPRRRPLGLRGLAHRPVQHPRQRGLRSRRLPLHLQGARPRAKRGRRSAGEDRPRRRGAATCASRETGTAHAPAHGGLQRRQRAPTAHRRRARLRRSAATSSSSTPRPASRPTCIDAGVQAHAVWPDARPEPPDRGQPERQEARAHRAPTTAPTPSRWSPARRSTWPTAPRPAARCARTRCCAPTTRRSARAPTTTADHVRQPARRRRVRGRSQGDADADHRRVRPEHRPRQRLRRHPGGRQMYATAGPARWRPTPGSTTSTTAFDEYSRVPNPGRRRTRRRPTLVYSLDDRVNVDSHGVLLTKHGKLPLGRRPDREHGRGGRHAATTRSSTSSPLAGPTRRPTRAGPHGHLARQGTRCSWPLRGPVPGSGGHAAFGNTPGAGRDRRQAGRSHGRLEYVARVGNASTAPSRPTPTRFACARSPAGRPGRPCRAASATLRSPGKRRAARGRGLVRVRWPARSRAASCRRLPRGGRPALRLGQQSFAAGFSRPSASPPKLMARLEDLRRLHPNIAARSFCARAGGPAPWPARAPAGFAGRPGRSSQGPRSRGPGQGGPDVRRRALARGRRRSGPAAAGGGAAAELRPRALRRGRSRANRTDLRGPAGAAARASPPSPGLAAGAAASSARSTGCGWPRAGIA